jgi:hypothetical protein
MSWNELKTIWGGQKLPVGLGADVAELQRAFEAKRRRLARSLFWRDAREAVTAVLVAGVFAWTGWQMGKAGWPIALAAAIMLGLAGYFIRERVHAHRRRPDADAPLLAKLEAEIAELRHQRDLLFGVAGWYLAPCLVAGAIFAVTTMVHAPIPLSTKLLAGVIMLLILALVSWGVWALNRWGARRSLEPRLRELEELHSALRFSS